MFRSRCFSAAYFILDRKRQNTPRAWTVCAGKPILPVFTEWYHQVKSCVDVPYLSARSSDMFPFSILTISEQNVKWFGSHNWTTQQLWTATLMLPDASRWSQMDGMESNVLSSATRLLHRCSWILQKLWNRIQEYPEECIVVFKMLLNQTIRMCKFQSYWEYWPHHRQYASALQSWSHTLWEWLL